MPQMTVGTNPVPINSPSGDTINGQNQSTQYNLYLSSTPDVSPTINHGVVAPGQPFTWPGDGVLYICADTGQSVVVTYNVIGATMGGSLISNRPVKRVELLASAPVTVLPLGAIANAGGPSLTNIDVSGYLSVYVVIRYTLDVAMNLKNWVEIDLIFGDLAGATLSKSYISAQWLLATQGGLSSSVVRSLQVPTTDNLLQIFSQFSKLASAVTGTLSFDVYGSSEALDAPLYINASTGIIGLTESGLFALNQAGALSTSGFLSSKSGAAILTAIPNAAGACNALVSVLDGGFSYRLGQVNPNTQGIPVTETLILPLRPLSYAFVTVAGGNVDLTITQ